MGPVLPRLVLAGGWGAALAGYGLTAAITAAPARRASRLRESATRAGVLPRVVVRTAAPASEPMSTDEAREAA